MKDITSLINKHFQKASSSCSFIRSGICQKEESCHCKILGEYAAYAESLIPKHYLGKTIDDFCGIAPGEVDQVLSDEAILEAKKKIINYCWGNNHSINSDFSSKEMLLKSKIPYRRENGNSLIIHGDQLQLYYDKKHRENRFKKRQVGKTLLASIVMNEVLKQRCLGKLSDTYEWISFPSIKHKAIERTEDLIDYQSCDWLVVDNIVSAENISDNMKAFQSEKLNSIFMERVENNLPTILIFDFNVDKYPELHKQVGQGIAYIAQDQDTFKINLSVS